MAKKTDNRLNGILWLVVAVLLTGLLLSRLGSSSFRGLRINFPWFGSNSVSENGSVAEDGRTYSFPLSQIKKVDIDCVSETLEFVQGSSSDVEVTVAYDGTYWTKILVDLDGSTLKIRPKEKHNTRRFLGKCTVTVSVPRSRSDSDIKYDISNVSGSVTLETLVGKKIDVQNVSGSVRLTDCGADNISVSNVSGSIRIHDAAGPVKLNSVSGSIRAEFNEKLRYPVSAETVSGSVHLDVHSGSSFEAEFETLSGGVHTDFKKYGGNKEGTIVAGDGDISVKLKTLSGSITVNSL